MQTWNLLLAPAFLPEGTAISACSPSCLVECAPSPKWATTKWIWTSRGLLIQQQAWLGMREYDARQPACHYNLHIQPACGGLDYHNYHIRYLGIREDKHVWSVVDAPYGKEKSHR